MVKKQLSRFKTVTISVLDKFCNEKDKQYCSLLAQVKDLLFCHWRSKHDNQVVLNLGDNIKTNVLFYYNLHAWFLYIIQHLGKHLDHFMACSIQYATCGCGKILQGMVYSVQNYNLEQHQQIVRIIHFLTNKEVCSTYT